MDLLAAARRAMPRVEHELFVMRHGRTILDREHRSDGWLDYPLSDDGRVGLITVQQYLKDCPIKKVCSSSLRRCQESAHILCSGILTHPRCVINDELRTWNMGTLIGGNKKSNKPIVQYYMNHPDARPHAGESMEEFSQRFMSAFHALLAECKRGKGPILLVTSGSNCREISRQITGSTFAFDLDESGLMRVWEGEHGLRGEVIFGRKDADDLDS